MKLVDMIRKLTTLIEVVIGSFLTLCGGVPKHKEFIQDLKEEFGKAEPETSDDE